MPSTVTLFDLDLTERVIAWGQIEMIKTAQLGQGEMFTSELVTVFENVDGALTKAGPTSLVGGVDWYGENLTIQRDGITIFDGLVTDIQNDETARSATVVCENIFKRPADKIIVSSGQRVNPAQAMLAILRSVMSDDLINVGSFNSAGARALAAGAYITYKFLDADEVTVMAALNEIAQLSSLAVYVRDGLFHAEVFRPYQGNSSDLRFPITDAIVRQWGVLHWDTANFFNQVRVGYTADDYVLRTDSESVRINKTTRELPFDGEAAVVSHDENSAIYFCRTVLERVSVQRALLNVAAGVELWNTKLGDRYPITHARQGLSSFPMEVVEVRPKLDREDVELSLAELVE